MKYHFNTTGEEIVKDGRVYKCIENGTDYVTAVSADGMLITRKHPDGGYLGAKCSAGYYQTRIRNRTVYVHMLVFEAFVGRVPDGLEIDHINADRGDNRLSNLRVVTHTQNMRNETTVKKSRGIRLSNASKASSARKIPVYGANVLTGIGVGPFESIAAAGAATGVEPSNIAAVIRGRLFTAVGYLWRKAAAE